jgi:HEAT repeats/Putative zinc-finger
MNCETVQENLSLYLYGELNFHDEEQFDLHISSCSFCAAALDRERVWHAAALSKSADPSLDLLSSCRHELSRNLDALKPPQPSRWEQFLETLDIRPSHWTTQLAAASLLLCVGFSVGHLMDHQGVPATGEMSLMTPSASMPVRYIRQAPGGDVDQVEIGVDEIKRHRLLFRRDDPALKPWAIAAVSEADDPSLRLDSIELLSSQPCSDAKGSLLNALRDANSAVRQRAIGALQPCGPDPAVQTSIVQVLATDPNPVLRTQAIQFLLPFAGTVTVRGQFADALQGVAERESDGHLRLRYERVLQEIKASPVTY